MVCYSTLCGESSSLHFYRLVTNQLPWWQWYITYSQEGTQSNITTHKSQTRRISNYCFEYYIIPFVLLFVLLWCRHNIIVIVLLYNNHINTESNIFLYSQIERSCVSCSPHNTSDRMFVYCLFHSCIIIHTTGRQLLARSLYVS